MEETGLLVKQGAAQEQALIQGIYILKLFNVAPLCLISLLSDTSDNRILYQLSDLNFPFLPM
jgi:energy-coupling factor transporter transmembrane protein EcfT